MQTAWQRIGDLLRCTACEGGVDAATDGTALVCRRCGERFPIINGIPCFVDETLVDYSELPAAERPTFLEMKKIAYDDSSLVGRMYNHYHRFAARRRAAVTGNPVMLDIGCGMGEHYPHISDTERQSAAYIGIVSTGSSWSISGEIIRKYRCCRQPPGISPLPGRVWIWCSCWPRLNTSPWRTWAV